jgi:thymidylate synthase
MRILVATQGPYGERIARNLSENAPPDWTVEELKLPRALPALIEEPDDFLPEPLPQADLLIAAGESPGAAQLIRDIVERTGIRAVVAPIDNSAWLPQGLANQLKRELAQEGVASVFPKPFCSLTENSYGYRGAAQPYEDETISAFAQHFGRPKLRITVNPETRLIEHVEVERDSACGSVAHTARKMIGLSADEADTKAGLILHHYPCLCSMTTEQIDDRLQDTLMHVSGYIINEEVAEQVKPFKTPPVYLKPDEYVGDK